MLDDKSLFRNQFIISKKSLDFNFVEIKSGDWYLYAHHELPVIQLRDQFSKFVGWLIGYPVLENQLLSGTANTNPDYKQFLKSLSGRFVAVILEPGACRVYTDAGGSLGVVFCANMEMVASTTSMLGKLKEDITWDHQLAQACSNSFIPFGLTNHTDVHRVLPNHYLDLDTWKQHRHFLPDNSNYLANLSESASKISNIIEQTIQALVPHGLSMTLTAGADNRMMLAASKKFKDEILYFTNQKSHNIDIHLTKVLRRKLNLQHLFLPTPAATIEQQELLNLSTGYGFEKASLKTWPVHKEHIHSCRFQLTGTGGETGRCFYWLKGDENIEQLNSKIILTRLKLPYGKRLIGACDNWLAGLGNLPAPVILDMLFWEINTGCRSSANMYAYDAFGITPIHCFNNHSIYEAMVLLNATEKKNNRVVIEVCHILWPELTKYPINNYNDFRCCFIKLLNGTKKVFKPIYLKTKWQY